MADYRGQARAEIEQQDPYPGETTKALIDRAFSYGGYWGSDSEAFDRYCVVVGWLCSIMHERDLQIARLKGLVEKYAGIASGESDNG